MSARHLQDRPVLSQIASVGSPGDAKSNATCSAVFGESRGSGPEDVGSVKSKAGPKETPHRRSLPKKKKKKKEEEAHNCRCSYSKIVRLPHPNLLIAR